MIRKIVGALLVATMVVLAGCGGNKQQAAVDIVAADAAATLVEQGGFSDTKALISLSDNLVDSFYAMNDAVKEYAIYIDGSGGTAREVAVLKTADAKDIAKAREVLNSRLETLKREFQNYRPEEMKKIDNPVIVEQGNVVFMVLSDDPQKAEQAIMSLYES